MPGYLQGFLVLALFLGAIWLTGYVFRRILGPIKEISADEQEEYDLDSRQW